MLNKIFIGGIPRSGTTMAQNILDSHPLIYGGPEFDRIPNIIDLRNRLQNSFTSGSLETYTSRENIDASIANFINSLFRNIEANNKINYISEKTPWNILFFEELIEIFPNEKFIIIIRNPLDVFSSMKKVASNAKDVKIDPPDFTKNYKLAVAYMESVFGLMEKLISKKQNENLYLLKYESLLNNIEEETIKLCEFIGVEWSEKLLDFYKIKHSGEDTMTKNGIWYTKSMFNADPSKVKKKKLNLNILEKIFIKYMFRKNKFLIENNYSFKINMLERIIGKIIYIDYKNKYRFKSTPKRILP